MIVFPKGKPPYSGGPSSEQHHVNDFASQSAEKATKLVQVTLCCSALHNDRLESATAREENEAENVQRSCQALTRRTDWRRQGVSLTMESVLPFKLARTA